MNNKIQNDPLNFILGKGEMKELIRKKDWSTTSIGHPDTWTQSLKTTLSIILNSKFPMFLFWGEDCLCFYNDAYRPSLGNNGKHPNAIGCRGEDVWPEVWDIIYPMIQSVLGGQGSTWSEDQLIPIFRNGKIEDVYWTYSYSPVADETGNISGVFVTCHETTEKVLNRIKLNESKDQLHFAIEAAELGTWDYNPATNTFTANNTLKEWFGLPPQSDFNLEMAINAIADEDKVRVKNAIENALNYASGGRYEIEYTIVQPVTKNEIIVLGKGKVWFNENKIAYRFNGTLQDITMQARYRKQIEEKEQQLRLAIDGGELGTFNYNYHNNTIICSNKTNELFGLTEIKSPDLNVYIETVFSEDKTRFKNIFSPENVYGNSNLNDLEFRTVNKADGKIKWLRSKGKVIYDNENKPLQYLGILQDISQQKINETALHNSEQKIRTIIEHAPFPIGVYVGKEMIIELANQAIIDIWGKGNNVIGKRFAEILPELESKEIFEQLDHVFTTGKHFHARNQKIALERDGELQTFYFNYAFTPLYNNEGELYGVMNSAADVTDLALLNKKIEESEATFQLLADSMPQFVWASDGEGKLNYFNEAVYKFSGLTKEQIENEGWLQIVHPEERLENLKKWMHSINTGEDFIFEHRFRRYDGAYRWQLSRAVPQRNNEGEIYTWIGTSTDIEEQKTFSANLEAQVNKRTEELIKLYEELKKSEDRYHRMVSEVKDYAILYLNKEGIIENWNKGAEKIKGYTADEIIGKNFSIFYPAEAIRNNLPQTLLQQASINGSAKHEGWRVRKDGSQFWGSIVITALHDDQNNIIGFSKVTRDLTAIKEADDKIKRDAIKLQQQNTDLEKMNKELESFAYIASHDLQEPLRKILTYISFILLKDGDALSENAKNYFNRIQLASKRMQQLIDDILSYSRTTHNTNEFEFCDLNLLLYDVLNDLKDEIENKKATIEKSELIQLQVIPFQFRQLLQNLISNSLKFAKQGVPPRILIKGEIIDGSTISFIHVQQGKSYYHLCIQDNGIGFDSQYSTKIFQLFQRLHSKQEYQGTGIGLAIVKKIVENHNGFITATSTETEGATFDIFIPIEEL